MRYFSACAILILALVCSGLAQGKKALLPAGQWTQASHPMWVDAAPVNVKTVTTDASKGLSVTSVVVANRSDRFVTAVVLRWVLYSRQAGARGLRSGLTPLIVLDPALPPGENVRIDTLVVSFAQEAKFLDTRSGEFHISVGMSEATYDDGSVWEGIQANAARWYLPLLFQMPCKKCQNQTCRYNPSSESYICGNGYCETCQVSSNTTCSMSHCEESTPGGDDLFPY